MLQQGHSHYLGGSVERLPLLQPLSKKEGWEQPALEEE
jgi:hypothetical protein